MRYVVFMCALGLLLNINTVNAETSVEAAPDVAKLKSDYKRPTDIPYLPDNAYTK